MFKSVRDYDTAVCMILDNIRNEKTEWYRINHLPQDDIDDVIEFIDSNGLAKGMHIQNEVSGFRVVRSGNLRITRLGLAFIEQNFPEN